MASPRPPRTGLRLRVWAAVSGVWQWTLAAAAESGLSSPQAGPGDADAAWSVRELASVFHSPGVRIQPDRNIQKRRCSLGRGQCPGLGETTLPSST